MLVAAFMVWGLGVSPLRASQYLGEVTWNYVDNLGHSFTLKAGLSKVGGSYYEMQGQGNPGNGTIIFPGGGALVGSTLMLSGAATMVETNKDGVYHDPSVWRMDLDQSSLNGTMWMVTNWYNPAFSPPFGHSYNTGALTKIGGPLKSALAPTLPLLLE
jgi:hypothetical protein